MRAPTPLWMLLPLLSAPPGLAAETTILNDSTLGGTPSTVADVFLAGESIASTLTSSCDGDIVAAQVYWAAQLPGAPPQIEQSISLFGAGVFPVPGPVLVNQGGANAAIGTPTLQEGAMNEYRFLDPPTNAVPLSVPVSAGQSFVVSLLLLNQSAGGGPFAPSVVYDQDGCQAGLNAVDVIPGGWSNACPLGVTGDWVIRAVVDCDEVPVPLAGGWSLLGLGLAVAASGATALQRRVRER